MGRPVLPIGEHGEITVHEHRPGSFQALARFRDHDGVTRRVTALGPNKKKAQKALEEKLRSRATLGADGIKPDTLLSVLAEAWFRTLDRSPGTVDAYRATLDRHIIPKLGNIRIREATTQRLDWFLREVAEQRQEKVLNPNNGHTRIVKHGGPTSAKQCRVVLSLMMGMAARYGAIPANPVRDTELKRPKTTPVSALTVEQFKELRADVAEWAAGGHMGPKRNASVVDMLDLFVATGLRPGELLAVQYKDINLKAGTLAVTGTVKRTKVEGLHRQSYPKSEHGDRVLQLPVFALTMLRTRKMAAPDKRGLVFTNRLGGVMEPANFSRLWVQARGEKWAWVEPRSFRKAVATLIEREADSIVASKQLGHSSDEVTRRHYIERNKLAPDSRIVLDQFGA